MSVHKSLTLVYHHRSFLSQQIKFSINSKLVIYKREAYFCIQWVYIYSKFKIKKYSSHFLFARIINVFWEIIIHVEK